MDWSADPFSSDAELDGEAANESGIINYMTYLVVGSPSPVKSSKPIFG